MVKILTWMLKDVVHVSFQRDFWFMSEFISRCYLATALFVFLKAARLTVWFISFRFVSVYLEQFTEYVEDSLCCAT